MIHSRHVLDITKTIYTHNKNPGCILECRECIVDITKTLCFYNKLQGCMLDRQECILDCQECILDNRECILDFTVKTNDSSDVDNVSRRQSTKTLGAYNINQGAPASFQDALL